MLTRQSPGVKHCQERIAECERLADLAETEGKRDYYLRLAENWPRLADTREFTERIERFLGNLKVVGHD
jgi:hypothetical protein